MQISLGLTCFQFAFALLLLSSHTRLGLCRKNRKNGNAELKSRAVNEIKNVLAEVAKVAEVLPFLPFLPVTMVKLVKLVKLVT